MDEFRANLEKLCLIGIDKVEDVSAAAPEPLLQMYKHEGKSRVMYRHAPIALMSVTRFGSFAQLPRAVLRLDAPDTTIANGLASFWRTDITAAVLRPNAPGFWRELRALIERLSIYGANEARKLGAKAYLCREAERLALVMEAGELGKAHVEGEGPRAIVTLTPSAMLATVYGPLLEAKDDAAARAERRAD